MTTIFQRNIRSSSWKTDFLIGFPEGLFQLFFVTQMIQVFPITVQTFYNIILCVWLASALLVACSSFLANKSDTNADNGLLSDKERIKLLQLNINTETITHIEHELIKDAQTWDQLLEKNKVQEISLSRSRVILSTFLTAFFFLSGGFIPLAPYLYNENFSIAAQTSIMLVFLALTIFSFVKAKITVQRFLPIIVRYWLIEAGIFLSVWILHKTIF